MQNGVTYLDRYSFSFRKQVPILNLQIKWRGDDQFENEEN